MEILDFYGIDCKGKNAVVIGRSLVVGKPAGMMLMGKNATVTTCHTRTVNTAEICKNADIIVSAAGVLNSLTADYVRPGQVVIDVSINWDANKPNAKGGLGGIVYITAGVNSWKFENGVAGFGFLAMAVMIFGGWHPLKIALAALLFGFLRALGNVYSGFDILMALNMPSVVYNMLPYIISLVVLAFTSKKSRAPKAEGIPYDKGSR